MQFRESKLYQGEIQYDRYSKENFQWNWIIFMSYRKLNDKRFQSFQFAEIICGSRQKVKIKENNTKFLKIFKA